MVRCSLDRWREKLGFPIPISPSLDSSWDGSVKTALAESPEAVGTVAEALMWLRLGRFDPAHVIVQDASHGIAAYVHGMLHRLEGDFWNANYWFRQTRDPKLEAWIQEFFRKRNGSRPLFEGFDPAKFTDACELWLGKSELGERLPAEVLQGMALLEWEAVWENALNSLF
jgi:hypothetical protein